MAGVTIMPKQVVVLSPMHAPRRRPAGARLAASRVHRSVRRVLRENVLCALATVTPDGRAHISHVYFSYSDDLVLYFLSDPASLHCRNMRANPAVAVTVYRSDQPWDRPGRGFHLFGVCRRAAAPEVARAEQTYARRFPAYRRWRTGSAAGARPTGTAIASIALSPRGCRCWTSASSARGSS